MIEKHKDYLIENHEESWRKVMIESHGKKTW